MTEPTDEIFAKALFEANPFYDHVAAAADGEGGWENMAPNDAGIHDLHTEMGRAARAVWVSADVPKDGTAPTPEELVLALRDCWGALNFILAFYEPGQRYLDTNAWKNAEAGGRRAHAKAEEMLKAMRAFGA